MSKSEKYNWSEVMINKYGADSVRWFILSDDPPEKDVQWSTQVFLQQINFAKNMESKFYDY